MRFTYGVYNIWAHELDQKLMVQISSDLGEVHLIDDSQRSSDFPNEVCFRVENPSQKIEGKGLKKFSFGEYKFILGINYSGELFLFHSVKLSIGKKLIDGKDTLTLASCKEPKL